jgi:peroxiredoxin
MQNKSYRIVSETTLNKMKVRKQNEKTKAKISLFPSIPVQVFNVETKKVLVYNSKLSAARAIGVSAARAIGVSNSIIRRYII